MTNTSREGDTRPEDLRLENDYLEIEVPGTGTLDVDAGHDPGGVVLGIQSVDTAGLQPGHADIVLRTPQIRRLRDYLSAVLEHDAQVDRERGVLQLVTSSARYERDIPEWFPWGREATKRAIESLIAQGKIERAKIGESTEVIRLAEKASPTEQPEDERDEASKIERIYESLPGGGRQAYRGLSLLLDVNRRYPHEQHGDERREEAP
jgi:hypothetical protein